MEHYRVVAWTEVPESLPLCTGQGDIVFFTVGQVFSPGELLGSIPHIFSLSASAFLDVLGRVTKRIGVGCDGSCMYSHFGLLAQPEKQMTLNIPIVG